MSLFFGLTPSLMINVKCVGDPILHLLTMGSTSIWHSVLNVKAVAGTFNQEKALVRPFMWFLTLTKQWMCLENIHFKMEATMLFMLAQAGENREHNDALTTPPSGKQRLPIKYNEIDFWQWWRFLRSRCRSNEKSKCSVVSVFTFQNQHRHRHTG